MASTSFFAFQMYFYLTVVS